MDRRHEEFVRKYVREYLEFIGPEKFEAILRQLGPAQNEAEVARRHLCWQVLAGSAQPN